MELSLIEKLSELENKKKQWSKEASHSITKVARQFRVVNNSDFEPESVAIGPYYHGKHELKEMEEVKLHYMQSLLHRKHEVPLEHYFSVIASMINEARSCYAGDLCLNDIEFIEMLVLDGCFIIELLQGYVHTTPRLMNSLSRDLLLLENQIPFFVLCELYNIIEGSHGNMQGLTERVLFFSKRAFPWGMLDSAMLMSRPREVKHILDLIYSSFYPHSPHVIDIPLHPPSPDTTMMSGALNIPCAAQLKDANVKFKKKLYDPHLLRGTTVFDVEFRKDGVMLMPPLLIDENTENFFRNLITYELHLPRGKHTPVTDYVILLDCLIRSPKDIQILSQHGVIQNSSGRDEEVCSFINRLTRKNEYYGNFMYVDIFNRINTYHTKRWNTVVTVPWNRALADFRQEYFKGRWSFISVIGASVLLLLTIAQTVFSALSVK